MLNRPNSSSGVPVYLQLVEQVKHGLKTGALRPGELLPGVGPLAEALVINPHTIERAYRELEGEGIVDLRRDAGALVARTRASVGRQADGRGIDAKVVAGITTDRELETAREVQQRLLPQDHPRWAGLDYAGTCLPARAVGGDYYDFIRLSDTELAIAIGDVCGKGVSAALLMATLRAYLHAQLLDGSSTPTRVMRTLNRLACASFSPNRFATFFFGRYDSSTRVLEYVNAGHPPPCIFRTRGGRSEVFRLDVGGPVVGFAPECAYRQGRMTIEAGDLLVAFTDGFSEAMNPAGDEWGEERLTELIGAHRALSAREVIDRIVRAARTFTSGAAQHDDMTLVAVRIAGEHDAVSA